MLSAGANSGKTGKPLPYFSMIMAVVLLAWGVKTWLETDQMEADYVNEQIELIAAQDGRAAAESQRERLQQEATQVKAIALKRDEAQWQFVAAAILFCVVLGFFTLTNYLSRRAFEKESNNQSEN